MMAPGQPLFPRVAIVGLGLVGGSIAAGLRQRRLAGDVVAFDTDGNSLKSGLEGGIITHRAASVGEAARGADLIVLAVPVLAVKQILQDIPGTALITDVGSVKAPVVKACREVYGSVPAGLVPAHPIAGSERNGVGAADPDLFEDHKVILTPVPETAAESIDRVRELWLGLGATVAEMSVQHHDEVLAETSHLPHLLAYALVDTLSSQGDSLEIFQYAAGGFRDFTRIAASDPVMWRDIFKANGPAILRILDRYLGELGELRSFVAAGDGEALEVVFQRAKHARDHFSTLNRNSDNG